MTRKSPCHDRDMYGKEMLMCPACGRWYKLEDLNGGKELDEMLKMFGLDPSSNRQ